MPGVPQNKAEEIEVILDLKHHTDLKPDDIAKLCSLMWFNKPRKVASVAYVWNEFKARIEKKQLNQNGKLDASEDLRAVLIERIETPFVAQIALQVYGIEPSPPENSLPQQPQQYNTSSTQYTQASHRPNNASTHPGTAAYLMAPPSTNSGRLSFRNIDDPTTFTHPASYYRSQSGRPQDGMAQGSIDADPPRHRSSQSGRRRGGLGHGNMVTDPPRRMSTQSGRSQGGIGNMRPGRRSDQFAALLASYEEDRPASYGMSAGVDTRRNPGGGNASQMPHTGGSLQMGSSQEEQGVNQGYGPMGAINPGPLRSYPQALPSSHYPGSQYPSPLRPGEHQAQRFAGGNSQQIIGNYTLDEDEAVFTADDVFHDVRINTTTLPGPSVIDQYLANYPDPGVGGSNHIRMGPTQTPEIISPSTNNLTGNTALNDDVSPSQFIQSPYGRKLRTIGNVTPTTPTNYNSNLRTSLNNALADPTAYSRNKYDHRNRSNTQERPERGIQPRYATSSPASVNHTPTRDRYQNLDSPPATHNTALPATMKRFSSSMDEEGMSSDAGMSPEMNSNAMSTDVAEADQQYSTSSGRVSSSSSETPGKRPRYSDEYMRYIASTPPPRDYSSPYPPVERIVGPDIYNDTDPDRYRPQVPGPEVWNAPTALNQTIGGPSSTLSSIAGEREHLTEFHPQYPTSPSRNAAPSPPSHVVPDHLLFQNDHEEGFFQGIAPAGNSTTDPQAITHANAANLQGATDAEMQNQGQEQERAAADLEAYREVVRQRREDVDMSLLYDGFELTPVVPYDQRFPAEATTTTTQGAGHGEEDMMRPGENRDGMAASAGGTLRPVEMDGFSGAGVAAGTGGAASNSTEQTTEHGNWNGEVEMISDEEFERLLEDMR